MKDMATISYKAWTNIFKTYLHLIGYWNGHHCQQHPTPVVNYLKNTQIEYAIYEAKHMKPLSNKYVTYI